MLTESCGDENLMHYWWRKDAEPYWVPSLSAFFRQVWIRSSLISTILEFFLHFYWSVATFQNSLQHLTAQEAQTGSKDSRNFSINNVLEMIEFTAILILLCIINDTRHVFPGPTTPVLVFRRICSSPFQTTCRRLWWCQPWTPTTLPLCCSRWNIEAIHDYNSGTWLLLLIIRIM